MSQVISINKVLPHPENLFIDRPPAAPFIKWAGGKRGIIQHIAQHLPNHINTYYEPFVGGGAVFFTFANRMDRAVLSDANEALVITYQVVKTNVDDLIAELNRHAANHDKDGYYNQVRAQEPAEAIHIAARFIYLNKTCFNGLYRVNRSGKFNVPKGRYDNPLICDENRLRAASKALQKATIKLGDFAKVVKPRSGNFVYCDPPYDACFTSYQAGGFGDSDQERLRVALDSWISRGIKVMISNSDTELIRRIYRAKHYRMHEIKAPRQINCKGSGRGKASELIITSY